MVHMTEYGDQFNAAVAAELRAQRARVGMTLDEVTDATDVSKSAVQRYLNGSRPIPAPAYIDLCRALQVDPRVIFERAYDSIQ